MSVRPILCFVEDRVSDKMHIREQEQRSLMSGVVWCLVFERTRYHALESHAQCKVAMSIQRLHIDQSIYALPYGKGAKQEIPK